MADIRHAAGDPELQQQRPISLAVTVSEQVRETCQLPKGDRAVWPLPVAFTVTRAFAARAEASEHDSSTTPPSADEVGVGT